MFTKMKLWEHKSLGLIGLVALVGVFAATSVQPHQVWAASEKVLVVAQAGDIAHIDEQQAASARNALIQMQDWQWLRYRPVKNPDGTWSIKFGEQIPGIVEWGETEEQPDGTAIHRMHLRANVKFHSGNPVTAEDLKYWIIRLAGLKRDFGNRYYGGFYGLNEGLREALTVVDDLTLEIKTKRNMPMFWDVWGQRGFSDSKLIQQHANKDDPWAKQFVAKNDVGSGPYMLERWDVGNQMILKRYDDHWGPRPYFDKIIFKTVPDLSARVLLLKNADIDVALNIPSRELKALRDAPGIQVISAPSTAQLHIGMCPKIPPFDNINLRKALAYAFPYDTVVSSVFGGQAQPLYGPIPTGIPGAYKERKLKTDMALAKQYLEKSGLGKGLKLTLKWETGKPDHEQIGILFAENLRQLGVELKLQQLPRGQFQTGLRQQNLGLFIDKPLIWIRTPTNLVFQFFLSDSTTNPTGYGNDRVDQLLRPAFKETDDAKRLKMVLEAQDIVFSEFPWIFICQPNFQVAMRDTLTGYIAQNTEFHHFWMMRRK